MKCTNLLESMETMLMKLEQAKANNETLKVSYTTVMFSGSSGVGKTSLVNKLNKEKVNRHHHSTGVAKSKHTISIKTRAVTEELQWVDLDHDSMIHYLSKHFHDLKLPLSHPITKILDTAASSLEKNVPNTTKSEGPVKLTKI